MSFCYQVLCFAHDFNTTYNMWLCHCLLSDPLGLFPFAFPLKPTLESRHPHIWRKMADDPWVIRVKRPSPGSSRASGSADPLRRRPPLTMGSASRISWCFHNRILKSPRENKGVPCSGTTHERLIPLVQAPPKVHTLVENRSPSCGSEPQLGRWGPGCSATGANPYLCFVVCFPVRCILVTL